LRTSTRGAKEEGKAWVAAGEGRKEEGKGRADEKWEKGGEHRESRVEKRRT
jgi:hypothetical protein